MVKVNYQLTHQQLVHLSSIIYYQYLEDIAQFEKYSSEFNAAFLTRFEKNIRDIQNDTDVLELCQEVNKEKKLLHAACTALRPLLHQLKSFAVWAYPSPSACEERYGFSTLHSELNKKEAQPLLNDLNTLIVKLNEDILRLSEAGVPNHFLHDLELSAKKLSYHADHLEKASERLKRVTAENMEHSNQMWDVLHFLCDTGESIFHLSNPQRAKMYQWDVVVKKEKDTVV